MGLLPCSYAPAKSEAGIRLQMLLIWHVLRYPATRNKWKFGRNPQQLPHFWPQHATIRKISAATCNNGSFGNLQQIASGNWQQIGKYCRFRQHLGKMWQHIPCRNTSIRTHNLLGTEQ